MSRNRNTPLLLRQLQLTNHSELNQQRPSFLNEDLNLFSSNYDRTQRNDEAKKDIQTQILTVPSITPLLATLSLKKSATMNEQSTPEPLGGQAQTIPSHVYQDWRRDWNQSMIKKLIKRHDLTPVCNKMQTNFDDYYQETEHSPEVEKLREFVEQRRRQRELGESKINGNRIEILDLYKDHKDQDPDNQNSRFLELPAYLNNQTRNYDYLPLTKTTDFSHMIRRSHHNSRQLVHSYLRQQESSADDPRMKPIQKRLSQLRHKLQVVVPDQQDYHTFQPPIKFHTELIEHPHQPDSIWNDDGVVQARKLLRKNDQLQTQINHLRHKLAQSLTKHSTYQQQDGHFLFDQNNIVQGMASRIPRKVNMQQVRFQQQRPQKINIQNDYNDKQNHQDARYKTVQKKKVQDINLAQKRDHLVQMNYTPTRFRTMALDEKPEYRVHINRSLRKPSPSKNRFYTNASSNNYSMLEDKTQGQQQLVGQHRRY